MLVIIIFNADISLSDPDEKQLINETLQDVIFTLLREYVQCSNDTTLALE